MIYLVIAAYVSTSGAPSDIPKYYAFEDARACATDLSDVGPTVIAIAKRRNIRVEVYCDRDPRFGAHVVASIEDLKSALPEMFRQ